MSTTMASDLAREALPPEGVLPLRVNEMTPSVIICAEGSRISIQWREQRPDQPDHDEYGRAEAMAAFLVEAANRAIGSRVKALEWQRLGDSYVAATAISAYEVLQFPPFGEDELLVRLKGANDSGIASWHRTLDEAKAAAQADFERRVLSCLSTHTAAGAGPVGEAVADDAAVDRFAAAMKLKLAEARAKGKSGWQDPEDCSQQFLSDELRRHADKPDPLDVANFAMFLHQRGEPIAARPVDVTGEADQRLDSEKAQEWSAAKKALWKIVTGEKLNDGHYINAYRLTDKLYAAVAEEIEKADSRAGRRVNAAYASMRSDNDDRRKAEAALAETRERLEKVEAALRDAIRTMHEAGYGTDRLRAALTGDAQEAGK